MSISNAADKDNEDINIQSVKQDEAARFPSTTRGPSTIVSVDGEDAASLLNPLHGSKITNGSHKQSKRTIVKPKTKHSVRASAARIGVCGTLTNLIVAQDVSSQVIIDEVLRCLNNVEAEISALHNYIKTQNDEDLPLYLWAKYGGYYSLDTAVLELERSTTKLKAVHFPQDYLDTSLSRAIGSSTFVSKVATYGFTVMNKKTSKYMEEMEGSTLDEEARSRANAVIMEELQKLMEHSFRAAKHVWLAIDLLRDCKRRRSLYKDWAWSSAATAMTAVIAATVSLVTAHLYNPAGFDLVPNNSAGDGMYTQMLDLIQHTQAVTNLTSELYTIKLRDIDSRYDNLAALSESHGLRIDNLVEALGPPNEEGTYHFPNSKTGSGPREDLERIIRKFSENSERQSQRYQFEIELMRKNMNRMNIRLTSSIEKKCKG